VHTEYRFHGSRAFLAVAAALLTACGGGEATVLIPPVGGATVNVAPQISGTAANSVTVGGAYNFQPVASDANGDTLSYSISNRPAWATFSVATGQISGTPAAADVGSYPNITISVSDGTASTSLVPFSISVQANTVGIATLFWSAPAENTDGSPISGLAGYWIYSGSSATNLNRLQQVAGSATTTRVIQGLASGTYFFAVSAYTSSGVEGPLSNVVRKIIL
jgi:Putative Ig domain